LEEVGEVEGDFQCVFEDLGRTIQLFLSSPEIGLLLGSGARRERFFSPIPLSSFYMSFTVL
jgi:hypothetical protein